MLPVSLLKAAIGQPILVELKDGSTFNGVLLSMDSFMNINLAEVVCTSRQGDKFWEMRECHVRGTNIKYFRIPDEVVDLVKEDEDASSKRGGRGGKTPTRGSNSARGGAPPRGRGGDRGRGGRGGGPQQPGRGGYRGGGGGDRGRA